MNDELKQAIREAVQFLGKKLDGLGKNFNVNIDSRAIEQRLTELTETVKKELQNTSKNIVVPPIPAPIIKIPEIKIPDQQRQFQTLNKSLKDVETAIARKPIQDVETHKLLKSLLKSLKEIPHHDFSSLEVLIAQLIAEVSKQPNYTELFEKIAPHKEVKLDNTQLKILAAGRGGSYGGPLPARSSTVSNVTMTSANTQYSYTFPAQTVKWRMKLRDIGATFLYSWTSGTMPTSGTGASYISIPAGWLDAQDGEYGGKTIYFQSDTASQVMEFEVGQA